MSLSSEARYEFPEIPVDRSRGPLEKLWESSSFGTNFLSGDEVHRREQQARILGMEETERRLMATHAQEVSLLRAEIGNALANFDAQRQQYFQHVEKEVVRLAAAIARKIIGRDLQTDASLLSALVAQVLQRLERDGDATVRVAPKEESSWQEAFARRTASTSVCIIGDPAIAPGKCILETAVGTTTIDPLSELDEMEEGLLRSFTVRQHAQESPLLQ